MRRITSLLSSAFVWSLAVVLTSSMASSAALAQAIGAAPSPSVKSATDEKPITDDKPVPQDPFLKQLDTAIDVTSKRYLTANHHSPWQIFHGLLALRRDFQLKLGDGKVNAIEWIATSEPRFDNQPLLLKTAHGGKFHPFTRKWAFEGHPAQFMALLSQSDLPLDYKFKIGNEHATISDMLNNIMKEVNTREEVTWVLWTLQHYLAPNAKWVNQWNEPWSIERLVQIETMAPVVGAPCGGNHRLFVLTRTRDKHLKHGGKLEGIWAQADLKIRQHVELARSLQNTDGSFSSKSYQSPGYTNDLNERFNTTGHTMEFLSIGLPDSRLNEQWVRNAVAMMSNELIVNHQRAIDCGPLYHSLNALIIYRDRVRGQTKDPSVAKSAVPDKAPAANPTSLPLATAPMPVPKVTPTLTAEVPQKGTLTPATPPTETVKVESPKPNAVKPAETAIPSAVSPSTPAASTDTLSSPVTTSPTKIDPKTIDPGRVITPPASVTPPETVPPRLLPDVPVPSLELSGDSELLDGSVGTLKPKFVNTPPPSRLRQAKVTLPASIVKTEAEAVPTTNSEAPADALTPANR